MTPRISDGRMLLTFLSVGFGPSVCEPLPSQAIVKVEVEIVDEDPFSRTRQ